MSMPCVSRGAYKRSKERVAWIESIMKIETDDCIIWPFSTPIRGYGRLRYKGLAVTATRLILALKLGIDVTLIECALHSCDEPRCCNKRHLREGTQLENIQEAFNKGRMPRAATRKAWVK